MRVCVCIQLEIMQVLQRDNPLATFPGENANMLCTQNMQSCTAFAVHVERQLAHVQAQITHVNAKKERGQG